MAIAEGSKKNARGKLHLLAQEITFAKVLAGNDKRLRERGIKKLKKWLMARSSGKCEFTDDDFLRIWKGIFYCMWMADKLLIQEELAETISNLIHCIKKTELTISFIRCFFRTMVLEWYGIDQFRYDKFMMLVRRFLRQTFKYCRNCQWQKEAVMGVCNAFSETVLSSAKSGCSPPPMGLVFHFCDIYLQELGKVGKEKIPVATVTGFLQPFITVLSIHENGVIRNRVMRDIFFYLMKQSDVALEFTEKWKAWKSAGCPGESWEDMERVEEEEEEGEEMDCEDFDQSEKEILENEPLDPRAGRVDVDLPQIPFDSHGIAEAIQLEVENCTSRKHRNALQYLAKMFNELAEGKYPLSRSEVRNNPLKPKLEKFKLKNHVNKAVFRLNTFEQRQGKNRRKRKRKGQKKSKILQNIDDCLKERVSDCDSSLHNFRKRGNDGSLEVDEDISNIEPNLKMTKKNEDISNVESNLNMKKKGEIINGEETNEKSSFCNSTPTIKKRVSGGDWEVSDVIDNNCEKESVQRVPLTPSGVLQVETIVVTSKKDSIISVDSNKQKTITTNSKINEKASLAVNNKKVNIVLNKNSSQDLRQYQIAVKRSPAIPFDGSKQPSQGVLKPSPIGSRINPFYKLRKKKMLGS